VLYGRPRILIVASLLASAPACHEHPAGPALPSNPGIHVASDATLADTALATLPLTVIVVDSALRPAAGVQVNFQALAVPDTAAPGSLRYPVLLEQPYGRSPAATAAAWTDGSGRASVRVALGERAGASRVGVRALLLDYRDTVTFTIGPGALAGVAVAPRDTAVYAGRHYRLRGRAEDQHGNARGDPVTYSVASGPVALDPVTGDLTALEVGRAAAVVGIGAYRDTSYLSVVPEGQVAAQMFDAGNGAPTGLFLMQLDATGRQPLASGLNAYFGQSGVGWSPDGQRLALPRDSSVDLLTPGGPERTLVTMHSLVLQAARFSRDGQWVYFAVAGAAGEPPGLYRVGADSTGLQHLGPGGVDFAPSPSPDRRSVAYLSYRTPCGVTECLRILDLATNADRVYGAQDFLDAAYAVAWSPTQDLLAYQNARRQLVLVRSGGGYVGVLAQFDTDVKWLDWSPDGQWLVVAEVGVSLINIQTGLRLPLPQLASYGATAWRP
jgi:hypothetical protein